MMLFINNERHIMQKRTQFLVIATVFSAFLTLSPASYAATTFEAKAVISDDADMSETGLSVYPGAVKVVKKVVKKDREKGSGDNVKVDLAVGQYGLKVIVGKWRTDASSSEVAAFYRRDMARFGEIVDCQSPAAVTLKTDTEDASLCETRQKKRRNADANDVNRQQYRVGIKNHQRVVDIKEVNGATEIQLIYVNARLPDWMKSSNSTTSFSFEAR
jgi:hypothetical protein